jgi:hypothetical protein
MKRNRRRVLTGLAATGVLSGALAGGGVALASTGSAHSTAATATPSPTATTKTAPASGKCDGGPGGMGGPRGMGGPGGIGGIWAGQSAMKAAASYLGISQDKLLSQLRSGKSLAAVAKAEGKSVSGLESAMLAAATSEINASSGLSAAQKKEMISELKSHLNAIVTGTRPSGPGPGVGMGGGMGVPAADAGSMMGGMQGM